MFNAKKRRNAELEAINGFLRRELDKARGTTDTPAAAETGPDWERVAQQLADDREQSERRHVREMARLNEIAQGWETVAAADRRRSERLGRAVVRCWAEIGRLRRQLAERDVSVLNLQLRDAKALIAKLESRLATMQAANEAADWQFAARAGAVRLQKDTLKAAS